MEITTEEYRVLFNAITDTINTLELLLADLIQAQQVSEDVIISRTGAYMPEENK